MPTILFYVDNMQNDQQGFWINEFEKSTGFNCIIVTNGSICDKYSSRFPHISVREAAKCDTKNISMWFASHSFKSIKQSNSATKILHIDSLLFLYAAFKNTKYYILEDIAGSKLFGATTVCTTEGIEEYGFVSDKIIDKFDFAAWKEFLENPLAKKRELAYNGKRR